MYVYLSKKIAIPNNVRVETLAWDNEASWIAVGGANGLLKVLKLEDAPGDQSNAAASNLSMNQTLEGHHSTVVCSLWNSLHSKLTTSDENGIIIVWVLYRGIWYEEMINNRNRSVVVAMSWDREGTRICIAYEDGAVIVGGVDGNRLWGKELRSIQLAHMTWTPDGKNILFASVQGDLQLYDGEGNFLSKVAGHGNTMGSLIKIATVDWYNGALGIPDPQRPALAILYENGRLQLSRDERDPSPILIDTLLKRPKAKWSSNGSIIAVSGIQVPVTTGANAPKELAVVQFYDAFGVYLRTLKIPGAYISALAWDRSGVRLAASVDNFVYFANIRLDHLWGTLARDVIVYGHNRGIAGETLQFWNCRTGERNARAVIKLKTVTAYGQLCAAVSASEDGAESQQLTIYNAIGNSVHTWQVPFSPNFLILNKSTAFVANEAVFSIWQFKRQAKVLDDENFDPRRRQSTEKERAFHIDMLGNGNADTTPLAELLKLPPTSDPISSISCNDSHLVIARRSGTIIRMLLPTLTVDSAYSLPFHPHLIRINQNGNRVGIVDSNGILRIFDFGHNGATSNGLPTGVSENASSKPLEPRLLPVERKDVSDMRWSDDDPELFACTEKSKICVITGSDAEEPVPCLGYICGLGNLEVTAVLLDELVRDPEHPTKNHILHFESKRLREMRALFAESGLDAALQYASANPHPRLWKLVADAALEQLDFATAQKASVRCGDFQSLQIIKRLLKMDDKAKQQAEIAALKNDLDTAEKIYLSMDRRDLALDLRTRVGDYVRVAQLARGPGAQGAADDARVEAAWKAIGDQYREKQMWAQAALYYKQSRTLDRLAECRYILEDFESLSSMVDEVPESSPLLRDIAIKFASVGMCDQAAAAYLRAGDAKSAVDTCVQLNQWNTAIEIAENHRMKEVNGLLSRYAERLLSDGKLFEAISLYRKANQCLKAAGLLYKLADDVARNDRDYLRLKKLYILAALEIERHRDLLKAGKTHGPAKDGISAAVAGEFNIPTSTARHFDKPWRAALAYHLFLLAQRQHATGQWEAATRTCTRLAEYHDVFGNDEMRRQVTSLLCLSAIRCGRLSTASKALGKLEATGNPDSAKFEELAVAIFSKFAPVDPATQQITFQVLARSAIIILLLVSPLELLS
ncbi:hypothetical protein SmJEL517_g04695 [Synchytrium microbalum]|uniref:Uncharacterized protein n=1 Tax=Synchytrium microbalum TaxID=1806994 RepID=A0A507BQX0_9FUNG|nr:uncharacterized protein SmJEL517_g04695 [Synchytrium microbalum]TPX32150.1 hypothetical protein SmJEL517_g04695 [Synchytrium microbalum]